LSPSEHGKYWHDLAQKRMAEIARLRDGYSNLIAWQASDALKIQRLIEMLVRADAALATCGVGKKSPIRVNINETLRQA
jgi:hypothetical protein